MMPSLPENPVAVLPPPFKGTGYCTRCMWYAQKAGWMATVWPVHYGERWLQYACDRFLASFTHTDSTCSDRVVF